jgi:hypothetical protein
MESQPVSSFQRFLGWSKAMSKYPIPIAHDIRPARPKRKLPRVVRLLAFCLLIGPIAAEAAVLCYAQWCDVVGRRLTVHTPIIDWLGDCLQNAHGLYFDEIAPGFHQSARDPSIALPLAVVFLFLAMLMLKR